MADQKLYSRGDLVAFDGVDDDALGYWLREQLILPEPAEPRKHRRFNDTETRVAAILGEARKIGMNVQAMRLIASKVRESIGFALSLGDTIKERRSAADRFGVDGPARDFREASLGISLLEAEDHLVLYSAGKDAWVAVGGLPEPGAVMPYRSAVIFDLEQILSQVGKVE